MEDGGLFSFPLQNYTWTPLSVSVCPEDSDSLPQGPSQIQVDGWILLQQLSVRGLKSLACWHFHLLLTSPAGPLTFDMTGPQAKVSTDLWLVMLPPGSSAGLTFLCVSVTWPLLTQKGCSSNQRPSPGQPMRGQLGKPVFVAGHCLFMEWPWG